MSDARQVLNFYRTKDIVEKCFNKLKNSLSTSQINPLFYDDFNRSFNLSQYFNESALLVSVKEAIMILE